MQNLSWQYPSWYLFLCLLVGITAAVLLYRRDKTFMDQPTWLLYLMAFIRGTVVAILCSLLLAPLLKFIQTRTEPPIIVLAQDQSTSIKAAFSKTDSTAWATSVQALYDKLSPGSL